MNDPVQIDQRLAQALRIQFERRQAVLRGGAQHVGWKLGVGDRERLGGDVVVGYLTSATVVPPGGYCHVRGGPDLHADVEVAVRLGGPLPGGDPAGAATAIAAVAVAVEIVDLAGHDNGVTAVAGNIFHRAVAFGTFRPAMPLTGAATLTVNGNRRGTGLVPREIAGRVAAASRILTAMGHPLQDGDQIITGNIAQVPICAGDTVTGHIDGLGRVSLLVRGD